MTKTVKIAWLSRHKPLKSEIRYLRERLGNIKIVWVRDRIPTAEDAMKIIEEIGAEYVVPILPMSFVMHLVEHANGKKIKVLRPKMRLLHTCDGGCIEYNPDTDSLVRTVNYRTGEVFYRHYRFEEFTIIKGFKIDEVPL